jgi:hypothetical protein
MRKICFKVLNISEAFIFKNKKIFGPVYNINIDGTTGHIIENNLDQCKKKIYNSYKNQSITIFTLDIDKLKIAEMNKKINYDAVIDYHDIYFDENNILTYYNKIDNLEKILKIKYN